jgi:hypothetical protein
LRNHDPRSSYIIYPASSCTSMRMRFPSQTGGIRQMNKTITVNDGELHEQMDLFLPRR